jgi:hypothetical protein
MSKPSKTSGDTLMQTYKIDGNGTQTLVDYSNEITRSIIESASMVADHRGSNDIETSDVALILAKKLGIELVGYARTKSLHHSNWKNSFPLSGKSLLNSKENLSSTPGGGTASSGGACSSEAASKPTTATKRKYNRQTVDKEKKAKTENPS